MLPSSNRNFNLWLWSDLATSPHQMALHVLASVIKPDDFRPISSKQLFCSLQVAIAFGYGTTFSPDKPGFLLIDHRVEGTPLVLH